DREVKAEVEDASAVFAAEEATTVASEETTAVAHVSAIAHVSTGIAHIAAVAHVSTGITDFASGRSFTGVAHASHAHKHGVEHHGIAHHPHASGHGICPPGTGVPTSRNGTSGNRAAWVVIRSVFRGIRRSRNGLTIFCFHGARFSNLASGALALQGRKIRARIHAHDLSSSGYIVHALQR